MTPKFTLVFVTAVYAYFISVVNRSSMGVASLQAAEIFETTATQLALVTTLQLIIYAAMQIPVGVLVDRFGPKATIISGVIFVCIGQCVVAFAESIGQVIAGRMILGFGDAFTFVSLVRIVHLVVQPKLVTRMQLLSTNLGQLGQLFSAIPFGWALGQLGWRNSFLLIGVAAGLAALASMAMIKLPTSSTEGSAATLREAFDGVGHGLKSPFVRLAFWTHFTLQSASSIFLLLWGYPYLVEVQGLTPSAAGVFLGGLVVAGLFFGFLYSSLATKYPDRRSNLIIGTAVAVVACWLILLAKPGADDFWAILVLAIVLSISGPASILTFDLTRSFVESDKMGAANGIANMGGFTATFAAIFLVGFLNDVSNFSGSKFAPEDLEKGMWILPLIALFGLVMFVIERRKCRNELKANGQEFVSLAKVFIQKLDIKR